MSTELYEVLSLLSRYVFTLLGCLIVLRAFFWLISDRAEQRALLRSLPYAGNIGEFVVVAGSKDLPEGLSVPVPWEGILGSVRSADVFVPCPGVRRSHLSFSFVPGHGLIVHPMIGCGVQINTIPLNHRSHAEAVPLLHGSFLQVGQAVLRLRVYSALDPNAGFEEPDQPSPVMYQSSPIPKQQNAVWDTHAPNLAFTKGPSTFSSSEVSSLQADQFASPHPEPVYSQIAQPAEQNIPVLSSVNVRQVEITSSALSDQQMMQVSPLLATSPSVQSPAHLRPIGEVE